MLPEYEIFMNASMVKEAIKEQELLRLEIGMVFPISLEEFIFKYCYQGQEMQGDIRYLIIDTVFD